MLATICGTESGTPIDLFDAKDYPTDKPWLTVRIAVSPDGTKFVTIKSRMHVRKERTLPHCYGSSWTVAEILKDHDFLKYYRAYL